MIPYSDIPPAPDAPADGAGSAAEAIKPLPAAAAPVCLRCGYDLRGLSNAVSCPECGLPVRASREGTPLLHATPAWLRHMARACTVEAAAVVAIVAYSLLLRYDLLPRDQVGPTGAPDGVPLRPALGIGVQVLALFAAWLLSRPQPHVYDSILSRRGLVRAAVVLRLILAVAIYSLVYFGASLGHVPLSPLVLAGYIGDLVLALLWVLYLRQLAEGLARPGLAFQLGFAFVGWAVCIAVGRLLPSAVFTAWLMRGRPQGFRGFPQPAGAEYGWWAFSVYVAVVLLLYRRTFLEAVGPLHAADKERDEVL